MTGSRLDDPHHDVAALEFHLARDLPVQVNGTELDRCLGAIEEALAELMALPDDEALCIAAALDGAQTFLRQLRERFDAAATQAPERAP